MDYTPFKNPIGSLICSDLEALREVREGWYVEYKREAANASTLAKSIAAFANSLGGWLFLGVKERSKAESVAGAFPGIAADELDPLLQRIRQGVASHLNPCPHYDVQVVAGPWAELDLADGRSIVVVRTPRSLNTPVVHSNGVIYRRLGEGSEPKPESDRFVLDQLWRRSTELEEDYRRWVDKVPEFSGSESDRPYLRLLLVPDLWRETDLWCSMTIEEARRVFRGWPDANSIPFEAVHKQSHGFVARQIADNDPAGLGITWWLRRDFRSEILVPINTYDFDDLGQIPRTLSAYTHAARLGDALKAQGFRTAKLLDLNTLLASLAGALNMLAKMLEAEGWDRPIWAKAQLLHVGRAIPFIDAATIVGDFEVNRIPICLTERIEVFPGHRTSTFIELDAYLEKAARDRSFSQAALLFLYIGEAIGLHWPEGEAGDTHLEELLAAFERSRVQHGGKGHGG